MAGQDIFLALLALGTMLFTAQLLGDYVKRFGQPALFGELLAGILLGPTLLGRVAPGLEKSLFQPTGPVLYFLSGLNQLAVILLLLTAGMEIGFSDVRRRKKSALAVSLSGIVIPFAIGWLAAPYLPGLSGTAAGVDPIVCQFFFATAMSISAVPVIAKILIDLKLIKSEVGVITLSAAVVDDVVGWILFSIVLGMAGKSTGQFSILRTALSAVGFVTLMLTVGRLGIEKLFQKCEKAKISILSVCITLTLFSAAFTEWLGIHALIGAFVLGVSIGDSDSMTEKMRETVKSFVLSFFAPLFFANVALHTDFISNFNSALVVSVLLIACVGKIGGCTLAARFVGVPSNRAFAVGIAMNARGAMEIILGTLALQHGIISEQLFVALVMMAIVTSLISGPILKSIHAAPVELKSLLQKS